MFSIKLVLTTQVDPSEFQWMFEIVENDWRSSAVIDANFPYRQLINNKFSEIIS